MKAKRYILIFPLLTVWLSAVLFVACGGKGNGGDTDSVMSTEVEEEEEELEEFSSPDLGLWHLTGPVRGAVFMSYEVKDSLSQPTDAMTAGIDSITFDRDGRVSTMVAGVMEKGKFTPSSDLRFEYTPSGEFKGGTETVGPSHGNKTFVKLSRSSGGYFQVLQVLGADRELSHSDSYIRLVEWANGRIHSEQIEQGGEGTVRVSYGYNSDGFPSSVVSKISDMGGETRIEEIYTYTEYDKYGNWTERRVVAVADVTEGEADGTHQETTRHVSYRLDRRLIYYYPPRTDGEPASSADAAPS